MKKNLKRKKKRQEKKRHGELNCNSITRIDGSAFLFGIVSPFRGQKEAQERGASETQRLVWSCTVHSSLSLTYAMLLIVIKMALIKWRVLVRSPIIHGDDDKRIRAPSIFIKQPRARSWFIHSIDREINEFRGIACFDISLP